MCFVVMEFKVKSICYSNVDTVGGNEKKATQFGGKLCRRCNVLNPPVDWDEVMKK